MGQLQVRNENSLWNLTGTDRERERLAREFDQKSWELNLMCLHVTSKNLFATIIICIFLLHILLHYKLLTCTGSPNLLRQCVVWSSTAQGRWMDSVPGWCHKLLCIASTQYWHHGLLPTTHSHPLCSCSSNYSWVSSSRDFKIIYWSYARPPFGVVLCSIFRQPFSKVIWIVHFLGWHSLNWS